MALVYDDETEQYVDINDNIFTKNHFPMLVIDDFAPFKSLKDNKVVASLQT